MLTASERIRAVVKIEAATLAEAVHRAERRCFCPDDCNCHYPHRFNYCGCKQHESA